MKRTILFTALTISLFSISVYGKNDTKTAELKGEAQESPIKNNTIMNEKLNLTQEWDKVSHRVTK